MGDPIKAWHDEHMYFARLLNLLRDELDALAEGETPNYALMLDIIVYLRDYSDHYHHPREDAVFERVARLRPELDLPVARLRQEHRIIATAGETLRRLLEEAAADAMVSRSEIEVAAATYLVYYGNHIEIEEGEIMPTAGETLSVDDWREAKEAAPAGHDPLLGANPSARFSELRRRISAEAA